MENYNNDTFQLGWPIFALEIYINNLENDMYIAKQISNKI